MDPIFYWLDHNGVFATLQHSWIWASVTALLSVGTLAGLVALARHYDAPPRAPFARDS